MTSAATVDAFVRIRPLRQDEEQATLPALSFTGEALPPLLKSFTGALGPAELNRDVFERCLAPKLEMVLRGGAVSVFSYGYTGGGKTHTIVGYGEERGIYFLAAEHLVAELDNARSGIAERDQPFLHVTACEIYDDRVFDLLGAQKVECSLRVDVDGQLQVVGAAQSEQLEGAATVGSELATLVTRTTSLRSVSVYEPQHLQEIAASCVSKRATGSSTEHAQSSRSHALLRMEVVTAAVLEARAALDEAKALAPALRNDRDNASVEGLSELFSGGYANIKTVLRHVGAIPPEVVYKTVSPFDHTEVPFYVQADGDLEVDNSVAPVRPKEFALKARPGELKTLEEWGAELGASSACDLLPGQTPAPGTLVRMGVLTRTRFADEGEWERRHEAHVKRTAELDARLVKNAEALEAAKVALAEAQARGGLVVGGVLMVADLAGADYDHRSSAAQKESAAINKSLLALKECLRALANPKAGLKPKFRDTKLTRLLEDTLAPNARSSRRNRESASVMLVNVSLAASLEQPTMNSLRYGQLFSEPACANGSKNGTAQKPGALRASRPRCAAPKRT